MKSDRPILTEAIMLGVLIFLVVGVLFNLLCLSRGYSSHSTAAERAAAHRDTWLVTVGSAAGGILAASVYVRYQRKQLAAAGDEPRCENCGYILRGLPEPRCPECGQPSPPPLHTDGPPSQDDR